MARRFDQEYGELTVENVNNFILTSIKRSRSYYIKSVFRHYFAMRGYPERYKLLVQIRAKEAAPRGKYLKSADLERIVNSLHTPKWRIVALIQFCTGIRAADALGIKNENCALVEEDLVIKVKQKGGGERNIFVPKPFAKIVYNFVKLSRRRYPFIAGEGEVETMIDNNYHYYWRELKETAEKLGFDGFSTHDFRRNFIEDAYESEKDIRAVSKAVGHKRIDTTIRYLDNRERPEKTKEITKRVRG